MKILHTSDWHLGRSLHGHKRYDEFTAFLDWLVETIHQQNVDVLLIAGDIFDTQTPSNRAQELYYGFLCRMVSSPCQHVIVIAGNHDSPSFLDAPKHLLRALNVHVIGSATQLEDQVVPLKDGDGNTELLVCAVPYLRDREIRISEPGESIDDKELKLIAGIRGHYAQVVQLAHEKSQQGQIPIIAMGHLFTDGGLTIDGDGVRALYMGSLAHVTADIFPSCIRYLALGHLHVPQMVNDSPVMRYSGSPIAMGFGEASQIKSVCLIDLSQDKTGVSLLEVPVFQKLIRFQGDWQEIRSQIHDLSLSDEQIWAEIIVESDEIIGDLREQVDDAVRNTGIDVLKLRITRTGESNLKPLEPKESLDDLDEFQVFQRCMDAKNVPDSQREILLASYLEIVRTHHETDARAE